MAIKVAWKNEAKREIMIVFDTRWTIEEFYDVNLQAKALMDEVNYPVHVLLDVSNNKMMPNAFMSAVQNIARKPHPNMGSLVLIGLNNLVRTFIGIYRKIYPRKPGEWIIYYASNYEDAVAIINQNQSRNTHGSVLKSTT